MVSESERDFDENSLMILHKLKPLISDLNRSQQLNFPQISSNKTKSVPSQKKLLLLKNCTHKWVKVCIVIQITFICYNIIFIATSLLLSFSNNYNNKRTLFINSKKIDIALNVLFIPIHYSFFRMSFRTTGVQDKKRVIQLLFFETR